MTFFKSVIVTTSIVFLVFYSSILNGQVLDDWRYSIQKFNTQDGLPSLETYFVHEDTYGYIWIGTDHGLVQYDGYEFKVFTEKHGLSDNTVFKLLENKNGELWLVCKDKKLTYYDRKEFTDFSAINNISIREKEKNYSQYDIYNDTLFISNSSATNQYSIAYPDKINEKKWLNEGDSILGNYALIKTNNTVLLHKTTLEKKPNYKKHNKKEHITWLNLDHQYETVMSIDDTHSLLVLKNIKLKYDSPRLLLVNDSAVLYEMELRELEEGERISTIYNNKDGTINISTNNGVYVFDVFKMKILEHLFPNEFITSSLRDKEGNLWVSTRDNGVWLINSNHIKTIKPNPIDGKNKFVKTRIFNDKFYASDISGQIYEIDKNLNLSKKIDDKKLQESLIKESFDFEVSNSNDFYVGSGLSVYNQSTSSFKNKIGLGSVKTLQRISNDRILIGTHNSIATFNAKTNRLDYYNKLDNKRVWCNALFQDKDTKLWAGTTHGLFQLKNDSIIPYNNHNDPFLKKRVLAINQSHDGSILVGSKGEGLIVVQKDKVFNIVEKDGLIGNMIQCIYVHEDHSIWVGTNKGVSKIETTRPLEEKEFTITNFTSRKGLPSNMVNDIKAFNGNIWFATSNGLSYINEESYKKNNISLKVYIEDLDVNDNTISEKNDHLKLKYDENNIRFNYLAICARCRENVNYKYRLEGFKNEWSFTKNRNVQYTSLASGTYTFQLYAANEDGVWNDNPVERTFTIQQHFSETLWFKIVAIIVLLVLILASILLLLKRQQKKTQLDLRLVKLEQQALRASMNPHFVFNALNSIQDFINKNDIIEANEYLVKFSHLIRANLEVTKTNEVLLKDELDRLELYLSIEKLRFQEKLNYEIILDKSLDIENVKIPVMILQPFVENAIIHGILPKEKGGNVKVVSSKLNDNQYQVSIYDDGVGITQKANQIINSHKSLSTEFTKSRLDLLSKSTLKTYRFNIVNLESTSDKKGTLVEFTLPI